MKTLSAWEARRNFGKLMHDVVNENQPVIIESHGEPKVGIVPIRLIKKWEREQQALAEILERASANTVLTEAETGDLISAEIALDREDQRSGMNAA